MEILIENTRIIAKVGDLVKETTDAIVNAANHTLLGGGGVDGAIHSAGGTEILRECKAIRKTDFPDGLPTGKAVITSGADLPARFVIHTVGPIFGAESNNEAKLLTDCYRNSLELAVSKNLRSIAFPSISTGAFYFPKDLAAQISSQAITAFLRTNENLESINLVFFSDTDLRTFEKHQAF
ncbi:MAG: O-acetyl-ADP-ribose deacetylase [Pyrinomonadaceae bacterium]|nr:O-acetyl-ADP-ribose deacetylase [Pyrinomonadaceae bacterium]